MKTPSAGFRFSLADGAILLAGAAVSLVLHRSAVPLWWVVPMTVGHFFLFCNVFRVRRACELWWAVIFMGNVMFWFCRLDFECLPSALTQLPITIALIFAEMRSPRYHGVFADRVNPRLTEYIVSRQSPNVP